MCGIIAVLRESGVSEPEMRALTRTLSHRGPDGEGVSVLGGGRVGLGHRRLAILDLSDRGLQPMSCDDGVHITYNGEIFNYRDLRQGLIADGYRFQSDTDTEVLIALFIKYGINMVNKLRGMYAFVIHDDRSNETYYARDPLGIKPLYRRDLADGIAFASEPRALRRLGPISVDPGPLVRTLICQFPAGDFFGIREIARVRPGEVGVIDGTCQRRRLPVGTILPDGRGPEATDPEPSVDSLRGTLTSAIEEHLCSDVPVGIAFSGGMDSTIIARLAQKSSSRPISLFSYVCANTSHGDRLDDPHRVFACAKALNLKLHTATTHSNLLDDIASVSRAIGEPVADPAAIAFMAVAKLARAHGHYVLLSGHGGDELWAGYRRHLLAGYLLARPELSRITQALTPLPLGSVARRIRNVLLAPKHLRVPMLQVAVPLATAANTLSTELWNDYKGGIFTPTVEAMHGLAGADPLRQIMQLDMSTYLVDQNLNYVDKVSMAYGVEARVPFLTPPVLSVAARLSRGQLLRGLTGKRSLYQVAATELAGNMLPGPKRGFGLPLKHEIKINWGDIRLRFTDPACTSRYMWHSSAIEKFRRSKKPFEQPLLVYTMLIIDEWMREWTAAD